MANYLIIRDPFNKPADIQKEVCHGSSIMEFLEGFYESNGAFDQPMMVVVDNEVIDYEDYATFFPHDNQNVVITPQVEGIVSIVLTVISLAVSVYLALTLQVPEVDGEGFNSAPSYSLQGKQNKRKLGEPIEKHYGYISNYYPSYAAAAYTQYIGQDQFLYQLFCIGEGQFDIADIRIKNTPIGNFEDVEIEVVPPFSQPTLFAPNVETSVAVSNVYLMGPNQPGYPVDGWYGPFVAGGDPLNDRVYGIQVDVEHPQGIFYQTGDQGARFRFLAYEFQVQELDDSGNPVGGWISIVSFSSNFTSISPYRITYSFNTPNPEATYQVRARKTSEDRSDEWNYVQDRTYWTSLRAYKHVDQDYGDVTLLAVKAKASNSLSGAAAQSVNLDFTAHNCIYNSIGSTSYGPTRSIVSAFVDVFVSEEGGNIPCSNIDWSTLIPLGQQLDAAGRFFDWTFEQPTTVWEAAKIIARCARATPIMKGSLISMQVDESIPFPEAVFTPYNMIAGSFSKNLKLSTINDYDGVQVEYTDINTGEQEQVLCLLGDDEGRNLQKIQFQGQRDRNWAYREGLYIRAQHIIQRKQVSFTTGMEGLPVRYGSRIAVATGVDDKERVFGRIIDIVGTTVTLD